MKHLAYGPETTSPILPSRGYVDGRPTRHVFHHYEDVPARELAAGPGPSGLRPGRALIYRCQETGKMRRWGLE